MELQHFSHEEHPLILNEEPKYDGHHKVRRCDGCLDPILSGPFYSCSSDGCEFILHKLCAELPHEIKHPLHPHHPLTLLSKPNYPSLPCKCNACHEDWTNFTYNCSLCNFDIDIICATLSERKIEHKSHKHHPLSLVRKPSLFLCNACGRRHEEGTSYLCTTCQFWIHRDCASLPNTIQHTDDDHPLILAYSFPLEFYKFRQNCNICNEILREWHWLYHCARCRYCVHVDCATSRREPFMLIFSSDYKAEAKSKDEVVDPKLIHLPTIDESVSMINQFVKELSLGENKKATDELKHFSHHHTLILSDHVQNNNDESSCSRNDELSLRKNDEIILCDCCILPISKKAAFYSCPHCNFFLHKCCADLPTEVQHLCHPEHPLTLLAKSPKFFGHFRCNICACRCNGFSFHCAHCQFYVDVKCGSLPRTIIHEAHPNHLLFLKKKSLAFRCNACARPPRGDGIFECETCSFKLDVICALLSGTVRHRYDKHPLTLTYSPIKDYLDEYFCEICEGDLNPQCWFYHCGKCDQSIHWPCIWIKDRYPNVKFGGTLNIDTHSHPVTFVQPKDKYTCHHCDTAHLRHVTSFQCSQCNFKLCWKCASSCSSA